MVRLGYVRGSVGHFELPDSPHWQDLIVCVNAYYIGGPDTLLHPLVVSIITPLYVIFGAPFLTNISRSIGQLAAIAMIGPGQSRHYKTPSRAIMDHAGSLLAGRSHTVLCRDFRTSDCHVLIGWKKFPGT